MAQNEDNTLATAGHDRQAHPHKGAADTPSLRLGSNAHRPETDAGGFSTYENTEKLDMSDKLIVPMRHKGQERVLVCVKPADNRRFFRTIESQSV